jgi:hypothetical protein
MKMNLEEEILNLYNSYDALTVIGIFDELRYMFPYITKGQIKNVLSGLIRDNVVYRIPEGDYILRKDE